VCVLTVNCKVCRSAIELYHLQLRAKRISAINPINQSKPRLIVTNKYVIKSMTVCFFFIIWMFLCKVTGPMCYWFQCVGYMKSVALIVGLAKALDLFINYTIFTVQRYMCAAMVCKPITTKTILMPYSK
jgi:hypothetical protein